MQEANLGKVGIWMREDWTSKRIASVRSLEEKAPVLVASPPSCQSAINPEAQHLTRPRDQDLNFKKRYKQPWGEGGIHWALWKRKWRGVCVRRKGQRSAFLVLIRSPIKGQADTLYSLDLGARSRWGLGWQAVKQPRAQAVMVFTSLLLKHKHLCSACKA